MKPAGRERGDMLAIYATEGRFHSSGDCCGDVVKDVGPTRGNILAWRGGECLEGPTTNFAFIILCYSAFLGGCTHQQRYRIVRRRSEFFRTTTAGGDVT